jgi:uncharacterized protein (TIGR02266 family)
MNPEQTKGAPVTLKIKFKSATLDQFVERYAVDISHGGIFIRTKEPLPVGTNLRFEFQLKDATPLLSGLGTVVWTREHDPSRSGIAPGMGVRFDRLPPEGQHTLDKILAQKTSRASRATPEVPMAADVNGGFGDQPTRVAPSPLVSELRGQQSRGGETAATATERPDNTPLPHPVPFHSDSDEFSEQAFDEATKVTSLDALALRSALKEEAEPQEPVTPGSTSAHVVRRKAAETAPPAAAAATPAPTVAPAASTEAPAAIPATNGKATATPVDELALRRARKQGDGEEEAGDASVPPGKRERADSDEGFDNAVTGYAPRILQETPAPPPAVEPTETEEARGGSAVAMAAAAALLLVAGVGGYILFSQNQQQAQQTQPAPPAAPARGAPGRTPAPPAPVATAPASAPPAQKAAPATASLQVETRPAGAQVELVGGAQQGAAPFTLSELEAGKQYAVRVSMPGYVAREQSFSAGEKDRLTVELVRMTQVLRITSTPPGAAVTVNGRKAPGVTPVEVPLVGALADQKSYKVSLRKRGFATLEHQVGADAPFAAEGEQMVHQLDLALVAQVSQPRSPRPTNPPPEEGASGTPATTEPPPGGEASGTGGTTTTGPAGDQGTPPAGDAKPSDSKPADAKPTDNAPGDPKTTPAAPPTDKPAEPGPTPAWAQ